MGRPPPCRPPSRDNLKAALRQVKRNKGGRRDDRRATHALLEGALAGDPRPVARWHLPATCGAAGRDRQAGWGQTCPRRPNGSRPLVLQAALQVLQGQWDGTFSASSYGF